MALCSNPSLQSPPLGSNPTAHQNQLVGAEAVHCTKPPAQSTPSPGPLAAQSRSRELPVHSVPAIPRAVREVVSEDPAKWTPAQQALVDRTLDLAGLNPTPARRRELVEQARAGAEIGFFYVKNFGVEQSLLDAVRDEAERFFLQPVQEKVKTRSKLQVDNDGRTYGYSGDFAANNKDNEAIERGAAMPEPTFREVYRLRLYPEETRVEKVWPPAMPSFKETFSLYAERLNAAAHFIAGLMTEGLGLTPSYLTDTHGPLIQNIAIARHRPQGPGGRGLPTHIDSNLFNFNVSDGVRGLQFYVDGGWLDTPALRDRALFNVGEDFETLSNGRYHAIYHRVLPQPTIRQSMLTTSDVGRDVVIGPAPQLINSDNPARYRARRQGDRTDHLLYSFQNLLKPDLTKSSLLVDPDQPLDYTKNVYYHGEEKLLYINGEHVLA